MCIAIFKPEGKEITKEVLENCYSNNSDGCGYAFAKDGKVHIRKSMDFKTFYSNYERDTAENPESPFIIHFRIGTSGELSEFNCHPFAVHESQAFIHNGVISRVPACKDKKRNDTQVFNDEIIKKLPMGWEFNPAIVALITDFISMSKLVILNGDKSYAIVNESKGDWDNEIWWSNSTYKYRRKVCTGAVPTCNHTEKWRGDKNLIANSRRTEYNYNMSHDNDYIECDMCGGSDVAHLTKSIIVGSMPILACRFCVRAIKSADIFYYEIFDDDDRFEELKSSVLPALVN